MPVYDTEAVALRTYDLGEADKIVVLYTHKFGKVRGVAKGAKRPKSKFGSSFEPMTHLRLIFYEKEGAELAKISDCDILNSPYLGAQDLDRSLYCIYFAELLMEFTQERDANENIFRLVVAILEALHERNSNAASGVEHLARYFEIWLMRFEGLMPNYNLCSMCQTDLRGQGARFFLERLQVLCQKCSDNGGLIVSAESKDALEKIFRNNPGQFRRLPTNVKGLSDLEQLNQRLLARHLGRNPRSFAIIKQLKKTMNAGS